MPKPNPDDIVLARAYRSAWEHSCAGSMAVLIWPCEPAEMQAGPATCWHYVGQHGACDLHCIIARTRPATPDEAAEAIRQWRSEAGYGDPRPTPLLRRRTPNGWMAAQRNHLRRSTAMWDASFAYKKWQALETA